MPQLCPVLAFALAATAAQADARPLGLVAVESRVFLAPGLDEGYADMDFLPLSITDWFEAIEEVDPLLGPQGADLVILRLPSPPALQFSDQGEASEFGNRNGVPEALRFQGLDAQTTLRPSDSQRFNYRPEGPDPHFMLTCIGPDPASGLFDFCGLQVAYPPDPRITLSTLLYHPGPFQILASQLPAMVERVREMALCLDVTDAPPTNPEAALAALLAANPTLAGCEDRLSS